MGTLTYNLIIITHQIETKVLNVSKPIVKYQI